MQVARLLKRSRCPLGPCGARHWNSARHCSNDAAQDPVSCRSIAIEATLKTRTGGQHTGTATHKQRGLKAYGVSSSGVGRLRTHHATTRRQVSTSRKSAKDADIKEHELPVSSSPSSMVVRRTPYPSSTITDSKSIYGAVSLAERLFPQQSTSLEERQDVSNREIPRLSTSATTAANDKKRRRRQTRRRDQAQPASVPSDSYPSLDYTSGPSPVLRIDAVSRNLTITDFRRIIPQGKHIEGWTLEQGDIVEVIPGRQLDTLSAQTFYFLVFASPESARAYYEHANTMHQIAQQYTPDALHASTQLLPPGLMALGMDVASVVQAYTLLAPGSRLFLRQLNYPLSTWTKLFVKNGGLPWIKQRAERHPFELRLTLDGPDVPVTKLRQIFRASGENRALPWSGGSDYSLSVAKWEPVKDSDGHISADGDDEHVKSGRRMDEYSFNRSVYIIGFFTEHAARSFRAHWHRRPLEDIGADGRDAPSADHPPILDVEFLW